MMNRCWCGNKQFLSYSTNYDKCPKCYTLISKNDFDEKIYHVEDEEKNLYGKNYWKVKMQEMTNQDSLDGVIDCYINDRVIYWIKYILKYIPINSSVAEIGCGLGQLAYVMKQLGYGQTAYEMSPEICRYVEETLKINILCGEFQKFPGRYDAVLAFDLLEHIAEPVELLNNIKQKLGDDGILCLQMPCYDAELSYEEMQKEKPRFENSMTEYQHVFLYSKESAKKLLQKIGFEYVVFEPACFGDDYDMFLFASKSPLKKLQDKEVKEILNTVEIGRLIKALISLFDEKRKLLNEINEINIDRKQQLTDITTLTEMVEEKDKQNSEISLSREEILRDVNSLNNIIKDKEKQIEEVSADREKVLQDVMILTDIIKEKDRQIEILDKGCSERLAVIKKLNKILNDKAE